MYDSSTINSRSLPLRHGCVAWLGDSVDYQRAWSYQNSIANLRATGETLDWLLLLEHAPVYTAGRRSSPEHVLSDLSAPLVATDRGGQITYHGPGQLIGYPIIRLEEFGLGPKAYVRAMEGALIATMNTFGIDAHREEGLTGVWTRAGKIAAIGVKIARGVTTHGFALNVATDLSAYEPIVPCGLVNSPMTSMVQSAETSVEMAEVADVITTEVGVALGIQWAAAVPP